MKQMKAGEITDDVSKYVWRTCELDDAYCIMLAGQKWAETEAGSSQRPERPLKLSSCLSVRRMRLRGICSSGGSISEM